MSKFLPNYVTLLIKGIVIPSSPNFTGKYLTLLHTHLQNKTKGTEAEVVAYYDGALELPIAHTYHSQRKSQGGRKRGTVLIG